MRILYCHNYYRHRGGEDISFETDVRMLREEGHEVVTFTRDNQDLSGSGMRLAAQTIWNRSTGHEIGRIIDETRPDLMHCNNLFPQISVSVYSAAKKRHVPIVQALRNYRSFCANSFFYRDGNVCTKCHHSMASWHAIRHRCYRDSLAASSVIAATQLTHRLLNVQRRFVDAFFTPTEFARRVHLEGGFDEDKVFVRNNYLLPDLGMTEGPGQFALFVGRLSREKGVDTVIDAWKRYQIETPLRIVGEGPIESDLRALAEGLDNIEFLGQLDASGVQDQIAQAKYLFMPSRWYETFGRTIAEAFSRGVPVIASRLGAMAELVHDGENGLLFDPGDEVSLRAAVWRFESMGSYAVDQLRDNARRSFEEKFCKHTSYRQLLKIYHHVLGESVDPSVEMAVQT